MVERICGPIWPHACFFLHSCNDVTCISTLSKYCMYFFEFWHWIWRRHHFWFILELWYMYAPSGFHLGGYFFCLPHHDNICILPFISPIRSQHISTLMHKWSASSFEHISSFDIFDGEDVWSLANPFVTLFMIYIYFFLQEHNLPIHENKHV